MVDEEEEEEEEAATVEGVVSNFLFRTETFVSSFVRRFFVLFFNTSKQRNTICLLDLFFLLYVSNEWLVRFSFTS